VFDGHYAFLFARTWRSWLVGFARNGGSGMSALAEVISQTRNVAWQKNSTDGRKRTQSAMTLAPGYRYQRRDVKNVSMAALQLYQALTDNYLPKTYPTGNFTY
jgi:hypothetical protein